MGRHKSEPGQTAHTQTGFRGQPWRARPVMRRCADHRSSLRQDREAWVSVPYSRTYRDLLVVDPECWEIG